MATRTTSGRQRYPPVWPTVNSSRQNSDQTSQYRNSVELKASRHDDQSAKPFSFNTSPPYSASFKSSEQTWKLFYPQCWRWLGTGIFIALILATLKIFEDKGNFSHDSKYLFNTIITALSLGLGLNFFEAFKDIAKVLRWRILASRPHSVQEVDLILGIESLSKVVELAWVCLRRRRVSFALACVSWLVWNLIAQAAVAVIGLTYSADSGFKGNGTYLEHGMIHVANLSCYSHLGFKDCSPHPEVEQIEAHLFGEIGSGFEWCSYSDISEVLGSDNSKKDCFAWYKRAEIPQEYTFRFVETNPDDGFSASAYPYLTNRTITASSGECYKYVIDRNSGTKSKDLNGDLAAFSWKYSNGTVNGSIVIPTAISAFDGTTYIYNGTEIPQKEQASSCGPRCMWMWAYKAPQNFSSDTDHEMAAYQCPITVGPVRNATRDTHVVDDQLAKLAASAIALQGRSTLRGNKLIWTQYQLYPWGSAWEIHGQDTSKVGSNMAKAALGSLAYMTKANPPILTAGLKPILGYSLSVHWDYVIVLSACIIGVHLILFVATVLVGRLVIIMDDSFLSIARLLRPLVEHLGPRATLLSGKELSSAIERFVPAQVVYGPRHDTTLYGTALDIAEGIKPQTAVGREATSRRDLSVMVMLEA